MNHKGTVKLETDRLVLRPFVIEDAELCKADWSNKGIVDAAMYGLLKEEYKGEKL